MSKPMTVVALLTALLVWYESTKVEAPETYDLTKYRPKPRKW